MEPTLWIARDADGRLYVYKKKPIKKDKYWETYNYEFIGIEKESFPNVKWEDPEPTKVLISILQKDER